MVIVEMSSTDSATLAQAVFTFEVTVVGTPGATLNLVWSVIEPDTWPNLDDELVEETAFTVLVGGNGKGWFRTTFTLSVLANKKITGPDASTGEIIPDLIYVLIETPTLGFDLSFSNSLRVQGV